MEIIDHTGGINNDDTSIFRIKLGPITFKWVAKHFSYIHNLQFQDKMIKGSIQKINPSYSFIPQDENQCIIEDKIDYMPRFGKIGS